MSLRLYVLIVLLLLCACGCTWLPGGEMFFMSQEMDYYLEGGDIANISGAQAADSEVVQLAREVLSGRTYYMGLHRHGGTSSSEHYRIESGDASCSSAGYYAPDNGTLEVAGQTLELSFVLPATTERAELQLSGSCPLEDAQQAINEVRRPKWQNNTSVSTAEAAWTLSGTLGGRSFSLSFTQTLTGRSRSYAVPI